MFVLRRSQVHAASTFKEHVEKLCKKASQEISALARISSLMKLERR